MLFDLDGVVLDTAHAVRATLAAVATCALGRRVPILGLPPDALLRPRCDVLADLGVIDPDGACARWWDPALAAAGNVHAFPGVVESLRALHLRGTPLAVVTLQDRDRLAWLLPPEVAAVLPVIVTRHDAAPKPAPDGLHLALDRLGFPASSSVSFVGDTPGDMAAAHAAGVTAVGVAWGWAPTRALRAAGAARVLRDPRELLAGTGTVKPA
ncbi:HAD family hydrolase [Embleya scabrispora]|uniref:HAD family hydrolase n=1 Tax=Embleya scabrispora TaxID=159449 RepID=UPI000362B511|nr:HAD hydrolase-like protein [Embleya scabrispora]MYS80768.1 HAD hydrolase-like protein [Streptomyces sp. SID5474]